MSAIYNEGRRGNQRYQNDRGQGRRRQGSDFRGGDNGYSNGGRTQNGTQASYRGHDNGLSNGSNDQSYFVKQSNASRRREWPQSPPVEKQITEPIGDLNNAQLQALKETVKMAKSRNKQQCLETETIQLAENTNKGSPGPKPSASPCDVFAMLNQHLGGDASLNQIKKAKRSVDAFESEVTSKQRVETASGTPSSHCDDDSASLGKRSHSDASELRLCGRIKGVSHFLDSVSEVEHLLTTLNKMELATQKPGTVSAEEKTAETTQDKLLTLFALIEQVESLPTNLSKDL